ncbi:MAG: DUF1707 SHOCT-like domain-containing protein [Streptosporangiaceae bacterium]
MSETMTTPGAPLVRASDAERDQIAEILRAGYAEGRLNSAELDERLTAAYTAKTRADLDALTSDLPGAVSAATRDQSATAALTFADPESGTGMHLNVCLLLCLLCVCPPAGIAYWILAVRRKPQLAVPERSPLPGVEAGQ